MPVLSVKTRDFPMLRNVALKFGTHLETIDTDGDLVYADLEGDNYRTLTVAVRAGATPLAVVDNIEHGERVRHYPVRPSH
jgi:hypothetical protein